MLCLWMMMPAKRLDTIISSSAGKQLCNQRPCELAEWDGTGQLHLLDNLLWTRRRRLCCNFKQGVFSSAWTVHENTRQRLYFVILSQETFSKNLTPPLYSFSILFLLVENIKEEKNHIVIGLKSFFSFFFLLLKELLQEHYLINYEARAISKQTEFLPPVVPQTKNVFLGRMYLSLLAPPASLSPPVWIISNDDDWIFSRRRA